MLRSTFKIPALLAGAALALTACGVTGTESEAGADGATTGAAEAGPLTDKRIMVPNSAGGGYDQTARTAAQVMEETGISSGMEVFNLEGAGGTVGLARTVSETGNGDLAMLMGLGVVGASYTNESEATLTETTPLAKLIEEPGAVMVPADSEFQTIDDLVEAWKADPGGLSVGGGSSPGGPDHLLPMQLAQAVGVDPAAVNFVSYDGGGDLLPAILGSKLDFATSGAGEFKDQIETGEIRVLAVSSEEPVEGIDAPTLTEAGIDLVFTNWRGIVAPPEIEDADRDAWIAALEEMHASPEWEAALEKNGWTDAFITGDEYAEFLTEQDERVADVLTELGLA
ncbi:tripartite tricarboxylate transporter substrate binding protein [Georgenia sp. EYE_87]|uniref:Bug family tripartite tricarboxylate transporter substrate binding protein n=1 Tax=Georgenia sp. EYE_87 TaxID=2853448 RepID=UPI002003BA68|nr:tripartite tricarboxylate transporter substrate-binding protein [Georgenia sp. EYE_87]MCK6210835.1 tripartite tricarboxylate transporter substrate binding protein [Georgenia sp. EYE_87]